MSGVDAVHEAGMMVSVGACNSKARAKSMEIWFYSFEGAILDWSSGML
jgi:hypothetical protein